jgi:hypothetical protein
MNIMLIPPNGKMLDFIFRKWISDKSFKGVKAQSKEPQMASDVRFCREKLKIYFIFSIWNHGNHGTLFLFNTHEYQETQIKNPFDPILSFDLIKDFWKWFFFSFKKEFFTKEFQRNHKWDDNNLLDRLKKNSQFQKCGILKFWKFKVCAFEIL